MPDDQTASQSQQQLIRVFLGRSELEQCINRISETDPYLKQFPEVGNGRLERAEQPLDIFENSLTMHDPLESAINMYMLFKTGGLPHSLCLDNAKRTLALQRICSECSTVQRGSSPQAASTQDQVAIKLAKTICPTDSLKK